MELVEPGQVRVWVHVCGVSLVFAVFYWFRICSFVLRLFFSFAFVLLFRFGWMDGFSTHQLRWLSSECVCLLVLRLLFVVCCVVFVCGVCVLRLVRLTYLDISQRWCLIHSVRGIVHNCYYMFMFNVS